VLPDAPDALLLLHNPRCSKSRAARALLLERGVDFAERRYLEDPLNREELADLAVRLAAPPSAWIRRGEPAFAEAGLARDSSRERVLDAVAAHPALLERPILIRGRRAVVGRPIERVLELLGP
jgi:arsenate reductase